MSKQPKLWGPDESGRWGNIMMELRDRTADLWEDVVREVIELDADIRKGEATRIRQLATLSNIKEKAILGLMLMQQAGAPVDPVEVLNMVSRNGVNGREAL